MKDKNFNNDHNILHHRKENNDLKCSKISKNQESDDIFKQLAEITISDDKSFESPFILNNSQIMFYDYKIDMNQIAKENNISVTPSAIKEVNKIKGEKEKRKNYMKEVLSRKKNIENNAEKLSQKLNIICSSITYSNIYLKQLDILMKFTKYIDDKLMVLYYYEPIDELFDIITELIYIIQKHKTSNELLANELQDFKHNNKVCNEKILMRLQKKILDKDKEIIELNNKLKKQNGGESCNCNKNNSELNGLKQENKELYCKLSTYRNQVIKVESDNKKLLKKINNYVSEKNKFIDPIPYNFNNYYSTNHSSNLITNANTSNNKNLNNKAHVSFNNYSKNSIQNKREYNTLHYKSMSNTESNTNINTIIQTSRKKRICSIKKSFNIPHKNTTKIIEKTSNSTDKNSKQNIKSVPNIISLLKEVNEMLRLYESSLNKTDIIKTEDSKMKNFFENMDQLFKQIYKYINKNNEKNKSKDKQIYVNISKNKSKGKMPSSIDIKKNKKYFGNNNEYGNINNEINNGNNLKYIVYNKDTYKSGQRTTSEGLNYAAIENYLRNKKCND